MKVNERTEVFKKVIIIIIQKAHKIKLKILECIQYATDITGLHKLIWSVKKKCGRNYIRPPLALTETPIKVMEHLFMDFVLLLNTGRSRKTIGIYFSEWSVLDMCAVPQRRRPRRRWFYQVAFAEDTGVKRINFI